MLIVSGSAHPALAGDLARELKRDAVPCLLKRFPDGEEEVELQGSVRGQPVLVVQPLGSPVGEHLLELLLVADACRRSGAERIAAVVPYMGFARQDRVTREGQPLGARVLARALATGELSQVLVVDLHSTVMAACIESPVAHVTAVPALAAALRPGLREDSIVVAPDLGAVKLAEAYAGRLGIDLAIVSKVRVSPVGAEVRSLGGEVRGKRPIVVDDMISTGSTVDATIDALLARGCHREIVVAATHGIFTKESVVRLDRPEVARVLVTDSLPPPSHAPARLEVIPLAPVLAEAIRRMDEGRGLGDLLATR
jgi:ribose-phosphate pyrophosphokinase